MKNNNNILEIHDQFLDSCFIFYMSFPPISFINPLCYSHEKGGGGRGRCLIANAGKKFKLKNVRNFYM